MKEEIKSPDIVLLVPSLDGGIGRVTASLASGIHTHGLNIEVWSVAPKGEYAGGIEQQLPVRVIGNGSVRSAFFPLVRSLRDRSPKTVISASFHVNCAIVIASFVARGTSRVAIVDHPSIDAALLELSFLKRFMWRILIRALYPLADKHVAISRGVANAMATYGGIPLPTISVIPNPVISEELFVKSREPIEHPFFQTGEPTLLFVGRLSPEKDVPTLLQAFVLTQKQKPAQLIIIGDGPERKNLENTVIEKGLQERVAFLGHTKNPYPYFVRSDVFVLSSTREGLPTVLIEALALGMKVVSTDCPSGPREILGNGRFGELVPIGDSKDLSESIAKALRAPKNKVPEEALLQYEVENIVSRYIDLI